MIANIVVVCGLLGLIYVAFKAVQAYFGPADILQESKIDRTRREAKENGLVIHEESYRHGNEYYVLPAYQRISALAVKAAQRKDGTITCYQKPAGIKNF